MTLALIVVSVLAAALAGVLWHRSTHGLLRQRQARKVIVTLKSGEAFDGLLFATDADALVLREATALAYGRQQENVIVEGEALILRAHVAYVQVLG